MMIYLRWLRVAAGIVLVLGMGFAACDASDTSDPPKVRADTNNDGRMEMVAPADAIRLKAIDTSMFDSLRMIEARLGGKIGVAAIHVESGWHTAWRNDETFPLASVAKLPMALMLLRLVDSGAVRLDSIVPLGPEHHQPGASLLFFHARRDSGRVAVRELLEAAMINSDNTAADRMLDIAGGTRRVNALMAGLGLPHIDVSSSEGQLILEWAGVDPRADDSAWTRERMYRKMKEAGKDAWRSAAERMVDNPRDAARPGDLARLLVLLQRNTIVSPALTRTLLAIMAQAKTGKHRLPGLLDSTTVVAHKTGTISSVANDVGIITLPNGKGHLAIVVMIKGARVGNGARDRAIAQVAAMAVRRAM